MTTNCEVSAVAEWMIESEDAHEIIMGINRDSRSSYQTAETMITTILQEIRDTETEPNELDVDGLVDVYNSDLFAWLTEDDAATDHCDDVMQEGGGEGFWTMLAMAQYRCYDELLSNIVNVWPQAVDAYRESIESEEDADDNE